MENLQNLLTNIFKEKYISDIIIEYKEQFEIIYYKNSYHNWSNQVKLLRSSLLEANDNVLLLKRKIKNLCKHTDVTHEISPGWERSELNYFCNICNFYIRILDDFDYKNITKVIDY